MDARVITGTALVIVQAIILIPLVIELRRTRSAKGVSLTSEVAWIIAGVGWSLYGALTHNLTLVISGALATAGSMIVCVLVRRDVDRAEWERLRAPAALFSAAMVACVIIGVGWLSAFLSIFGMVQFVPQILASIQGIRTRSAHGVPIAGTALRAVYTGTWAMYAGAWGLWGIAFSEVDWPLAVWGVAGFIAFVLQCISGLVSKKKDPVRAV